MVALPVAALRVLRRAGRWRALRVVLFLGGLLAAGFLWGGQAHAVEAPLPDARHQVSTAVADAPPAPKLDAAQAHAQAPVTAPAPAPATGGVPTDSLGLPGAPGGVREALGPESAGDVVRGVTRTLGELRERVAEHRPAVPGLPAAGVPSPPVAAGDLPVRHLPVTERPVVPTPSGGGAEPSVHQGSGDDRAQSAGRGSVTGTSSVTGVAVVTGPAYHATGPLREDADRRPGRVECGEAPAPAPSAPCGDGARHSAGDGNSSRPGDKHAAAVAAGARFGLVRGATLPATAAPTHDRPHEVLEFPG
ncbi:hypothetical protein AR457_14240 [Streptomyces agglomeratus]|uniref:hypothetical protein n=1 Tax=Streptomyces agglomeratus TaxID=285458 RepID=UPI0008542125|nr:hypothetical protein [Streptomyces agglomeratus]OEJ40516.1 hypothetical protein BGK70_22410 [Streptomyces agglomeratus]OEJ45103.1 hypothetical protein AR457_14240 [Streptomyces agglomeratus]